MKSQWRDEYVAEQWEATMGKTTALSIAHALCLVKYLKCTYMLFDLTSSHSWLIGWLGDFAVTTVNRRSLMTHYHPTCLYKHCVGVSSVLTPSPYNFNTCDEATWTYPNVLLQSCSAIVDYAAKIRGNLMMLLMNAHKQVLWSLLYMKYTIIVISASLCTFTLCCLTLDLREKRSDTLTHSSNQYRSHGSR